MAKYARRGLHPRREENRREGRLKMHSRECISERRFGEAKAGALEKGRAGEGMHDS